MMRKLFFIAAAMTAASVAPVSAKLVSPFPIKTCYELGRDAIYDDQNPTQRISKKAKEFSALPDMSVIMRNVATFRNTAIRKHQAAQCKLRREGKPYDKRCPGIVFSVDWVMENTPTKIFSMSREEGNGPYRKKLKSDFRAAKSQMEKECQQ